MNKTEFIAAISAEANLSKADAGRALDAITKTITKTVKSGGTVSLIGFGNFGFSKRAARVGRNPRTGAELKIKARKVPKFTPGKAFKDALNPAK